MAKREVRAATADSSGRGATVRNMAPRFHPFVRLLLCAGGLVFVTVVLVLVLLTGNYLSTAYSEAPPKESFEQMLLRFQLAITLLTYPACLMVLNAFRTKLDKASFVSLGLRPIKVAPNLLRGALAGFLSIGILWSILWLTGAIVVDGWSPPFFEDPVGAILPLAGYFLAFCGVAFFEEVVFRGYILHNLNAWLGWRWAVGVQAMLFAVVHLGNVVNADTQGKSAALWALPALFLIAVFFAESYKKTGSLWFPIAFHAMWNFSLGCLFSLPVSGIDTYRVLDVSQNTTSILSGGSFGAEGSLYLPVILLVMIYFMSGAANHPQAVLDLALLKRHLPEPEATPTPALAEEDEEEYTGPNRFNTRFGSQEGFDSQMLRELRELQKNREDDKAKQTAIAQAEEASVPLIVVAEEPIAVPMVAVAEPVAPPVEEREPEKSVAVAEVRPVPTPVVPTEKVAEPAKPIVKPVVADTPSPTPVPSTEQPAVPKKKPAPKW